MRKPLLRLLTLLLFVSCQKVERHNEGSTQQEETIKSCASDEVLAREIKENPQRGKFLEELGRKSQFYHGRDRNIAARSVGTLYVSVVVHIVLVNPNSVSDFQIESQIGVLNRDFNKQNIELRDHPNIYLADYPYNDVANCDIQFILSKIERKTSGLNFTDNDDVKKTSRGGSDPISPATKLNIWVCYFKNRKLKGYAKYPGGDVLTDGIVINATCFGTDGTAAYPFDLGRTTTHEIGHWLNLKHIFGYELNEKNRKCIDDDVNDTPIQPKENYGCPDPRFLDLFTNCVQNPVYFPNKKTKIYWMNYMDYTNDDCMYMFTNGQKLRMDYAIDHARAAYFSTVTENVETITDIDGNVYNTITIGNQVWLKENLKTTRYRNGDFITYESNATAWAALNTGAWCYYNNDLSVGTIYGKLYNWYAVNDPRGLAPTGWHISTDADWTILSNYLGGDALAGDALKETGITHWLSPNAGTNISGFTALPGSTRDPDGTFSVLGIGNVGLWWTTEEPTTGLARYRVMRYDGSDVGRSQNPQGMGMSVRCVKD